MKLSGIKLLGSIFSWLQKININTLDENLSRYKAKPEKGASFDEDCTSSAYKKAIETNNCKEKPKKKKKNYNI